MKKWVVLFCIVATVFAVLAIVYVIASVIRECRKYYKRREMRKRRASRSSAASNASVLPAMLCGAMFAISGLLTWSILSKEKDSSRSKACRRKKKNCGVCRLICR